MRAALILIVLAGCATTLEERWEQIQGGEWLLAAIEGQPPLAGTEVTLTFAVGRLYGQAVNRYGAGYEREEDGLTLEAVHATRMHRDDPPGAMAQEERYLALLGEVDGWRWLHGRFELLRAGEPVLVFKQRSETDARS